MDFTITRKSRSVGDVLAEWTGVTWHERPQRKGSGVVFTYPNSKIRIVSNLRGWSLWDGDKRVTDICRPRYNFSHPCHQFEADIKELIAKLKGQPNG